MLIHAYRLLSFTMNGYHAYVFVLAAVGPAPGCSVYIDPNRYLVCRFFFLNFSYTFLFRPVVTLHNVLDFKQ
jgi:hypothetical protein